MENRSLGQGRVSVPAVGLGTWRRLKAASRHRELIGTAIAASIRLFGTPPMYCEAERLPADVLGGQRDQIVIAEKIWTPSAKEGAAQLARAVDCTAAGSTSCRSTTWWPGRRICRCSRPPGTAGWLA